MRHCSRRALLTAGATGALTSLAGCIIFTDDASPGGTGQLAGADDINQQVSTSIDPTAYEDRFSRTVVLTDDPYNADPTGEEPIDDALMMAWEDDTLIVLPEGQYKMNQQFRRTGWHDVGLIGQNAV
ncbi:hypothetical protein C492_11505, partial [Natronococcus jeotgali DSM 18795]